MVGVNQIVERGVRLAEHWKAFSVRFPGKLATVDDGAAEGRAVPAHEFRQRMHDNIRAVFDGPQQYGRSDCIVDDQWHSVFVRHPGQRLDITDISRRITDTFAKDSPRLVVDQFFYGVGLIRLAKRTVNSR